MAVVVNILAIFLWKFQDIGFSFIEMNASDTRGKKALDTIIKESLSNVDVFGMIQGNV